MKAAWAAVLGVIGTLAIVAIGDLISEEVRVRLDRFPAVVIRLAGRRLPASIRGDWIDEWLAELRFILRGAEALPITRLIRGTRFAISLLLHGARGVDRELEGANQDHQELVDPLLGLRNRDSVSATATKAFIKDLESLSPGDRLRFQRAARRIMAGLLQPTNLSGITHIRRLRGVQGVYVMNWSAEGRLPLA